MLNKTISTAAKKGDNSLEELLLDIKFVPPEFQGRFNIPNLPLHIHTEGAYLKDHLEAMFNVLNTAREIPTKYGFYKDIICAPKNRLFFEYFIVWHDLGKITTPVKTIIEEGRQLDLYCEHEVESYNLFMRHTEIASTLPNRAALAEVIRLHGALYKGSQQPLSKLDFKKFIRENNVETESLRQTMPLLIAADILDVLGTKRPDSWDDRPLNFAQGYEKYVFK